MLRLPASRRPCGVDEGDATVYISKAAIIATLQSRDLPARADWVDRTLPEFVDVERNAGLLATLHIDPADLSPAGTAPEAE